MFLYSNKYIVFKKTQYINIYYEYKKRETIVSLFIYLYFRLILRMEPHSKECVNYLLHKFKNSINILKGYSGELLKNIDIKIIDFVFLDGGHSYDTVKNDLQILTSQLSKDAIIVCDDYNINHYGVQKAVNEIKKKHHFENYGRFAFLKIK